MRSKLGKPVLWLLCLSLACAVPQLLAKKKDKAADTGANEQKRAVQALNRLTFGPRPGDVQQVTAIGVDRWIDLQLHPDKISDSAMEARLAPFRTLRMSSKEIVEEFPDNQMIKQIMDGRKPMPSDPAKRAVVQVQIARLQEKQQRKSDVKQSDVKEEAATPAAAPAAASANDTAKTAEELAEAAAASPDAMPSMPGDNNSNGEAANEMAMAPSKDAEPSAADDAEARRREDRLYADLEIQKLVDLPPDQRYQKVMAMSTGDQLVFADSMRGGGG